MENKKGRVYYPEDFGAVGDGITDDTAAFKRMMAQIRKDELEDIENEKRSDRPLG